MKRTIITLLTLIQVTLGFAQLKNQLVTLKANVFEKNTNKVLPFATIFNRQQSTGTASNLDGYFELPNNRIGDTIVISYLGYEDKVFIISQDMPKEISLSPLSALLDEVVVIADSDYLYDIISKVKKNKKTKSKKSKTYFFLETLLYNEPIEIIESYYNGEYSNLGIDELNIKKGRIGLKPVNNRYFRSTESSRLFSMHDLFAKSKLFPECPLFAKKKNLKRDYTLRLNHTFNEGQSKIYVIDFMPKNERTDLFRGTVWIDQKNNRLIKVSLNAPNSFIHPFVPIGFNTIQKVDMEITKSYETIDGEQFVNTINFNYNVSYLDKWGNEVEATTKAFTKAYDYKNEFRLPNFEFTKHFHEDYRNITVAPYDSAFWNQTSEFRFYDRIQEVERFILENKIENSVIHPESKKDSLHSQLQFPYISWNENRFKMRQAPVNVIEKSKSSKAFEIDRYNLSVQLYLDVNRVHDSLIYQLCPILDPVSSYYHFYMTDSDRAFMNMYFDLLEIQKRELELEISLSQNLSEELITELYLKHLKEFDENCRLFIDETDRGKNLKRMEVWNAYILESLNIDNLKQFNIN
jgi:carboxypeptidase-like protein